MLSYSEKYGVPLPKKEELLRMAEKADFLVNQIISRADPTKFDSERNRRKLDRAHQNLLPNLVMYT